MVHVIINFKQPQYIQTIIERSSISASVFPVIIPNKLHEIFIYLFFGYQKIGYITLILMIDSKQQPIRLFVRLPNGNGTSFSLPANLRFHKLAQLLYLTSLQLPNKFQLIYRGEKIKNYSMSLSQLGVTNNSIIHIAPQQLQQRATKIDVAFLVDGDKFVVQQQIHKTIWDLKQRIAGLTGVNAGNQTLVFQGKKLKNHNTLQHYKITSDSLLCLLICSEQISVKSSNKAVQGMPDQTLVNSVASLQKKIHSNSTTPLFRSSSINNKNLEQITPFEIQIHGKKYGNHGFGGMNIDLFNSFESSNMMGSLNVNPKQKCLLLSQNQFMNKRQEYLQEINANVLEIPRNRIDLTGGRQECKSIELDY